MSRPVLRLVLVLLVAFVLPGPAWSQADLPLSPGPVEESRAVLEEESLDLSAGGAFDHYVVNGGWITWFVLIPLSITALALAVQYGFTIRRRSVLPPQTVDELAELFDQGRYSEALQLSRDDRSVLAQIVYSGLVQARSGYAAMERALEEAIDEQAARLSRKIEYLNLIGNVAPMVGLFGTVYGIIGMFISIADAGGIPVMSRISHDLGTALVATFWGLFVAIPSLTVFGLLRNRIDVLLTECAVTADRLLAGFRAPLAEPVRAPTTTPAAPQPVGATR